MNCEKLAKISYPIAKEPNKKMGKSQAVILGSLGTAFSIAFLIAEHHLDLELSDRLKMTSNVLKGTSTFGLVFNSLLLLGVAFNKPALAFIGLLFDSVAFFALLIAGIFACLALTGFNLLSAFFSFAAILIGLGYLISSTYEYLNSDLEAAMGLKKQYAVFT